MTPAAPIAITLLVSSPIGAKPGADAPTTTGTRPLTRLRTLCTKTRDSSALSLVASPMMPKTVKPVTPQFKEKSTMRSVLIRSSSPLSVKGVTVIR